jgi:hypothetical protein
VSLGEEREGAEGAEGAEGGCRQFRIQDSSVPSVPLILFDNLFSV